MDFNVTKYTYKQKLSIILNGIKYLGCIVINIFANRAAPVYPFVMVTMHSKGHLTRMISRGHIQKRSWPNHGFKSAIFLCKS